MNRRSGASSLRADPGARLDGVLGHCSVQAHRDARAGMAHEVLGVVHGLGLDALENLVEALASIAECVEDERVDDFFFFFFFATSGFMDMGDLALGIPSVQH